MTDAPNPFNIKLIKAQIKEVGKRVKLARQNRGMTQDEVGELIGISPKTISAIEVGRVEPSISQMQAIAAVLEEPLGYFVGESTSVVESKMDRVATELEAIRKTLQLASLKK